MITQTTTSTPLSTKNHFEVLDGLRGIAAIGVVVFTFQNGYFLTLAKTL
jgi:peptidoglycan/LPS O-acetylase OafA/YrhL